MLFKSDGHIRVRIEAEEVKQPSRLVPARRDCGGIAMIWGCTDIIFTHRLDTTESRPQPHREFFGCAGDSDPPLINTDRSNKLMQHWTEIKLVTLRDLIKTMPQQMLMIPQSIRVADFYVARQCVFSTYMLF